LDKGARGHYNGAADVVELTEGEMTLSDGVLVQGALQGDAESAAALYDRYFDRVYDFCLRLLFTAEAAAAAAAETLRRSLTTLSEPAAPKGFRTHLFSHAVAVAVRRSLERERPLEEAQREAFQRVDPDLLSDPIRAPLAQEEAGLVWEGVLRLDPRDYALLDLHRRQGLETADLAAVLQIRRQAAQRGLDKLTRDTETGISSLIMARRGSRNCEGLRRALLGLPIAATGEQLRRVTERHVRSCPVCAAAQRALVPPFEVFGALAAVPPSLGLRESARERVLAAWGTASTAPPTEDAPGIAPPPPVVTGAAAEGAGGSSRRRPPIDTGALSEGWQRLTSGRNLILPLGAALVVLATAGGIAWGTGMFGGSGGGTAVGSPTPTATAHATSTLVPDTTPTPSPAASATAPPTVEASPIPEEEATATATPTTTAAETPTRTPRPTHTPVATTTPSPSTTETPEPSPTP
jgi:DNA-directed RNA polymerase specialized sigma24 family protein